jgi:hypothetical protein
MLKVFAHPELVVGLKRCQIEHSKAAQFYEEKATKAMRMKNEDNELPALIT